METIIICGVCVLVLVIGVLKQRAEFLLNFGVRGIVGLIAVYFLNHFLENQRILIAVGINPITALTIGTLGIGGVALLYGIMAYKTL
ncbi:MAG: pro-sigmaK processing inhibitor BofA family protein [Lachnospiraceae bacterium]